MSNGISMSELASEPPKMSLTNIDDPSKSISPQYNPEKLKQKISANWAEQTIPGFSHKRLHYIDTSNDGFSFSLHFDSIGEPKSTQERNMAIRRFLMAHCYARGGAQSIITGAPPRLLLVWPSLVSMTAIVRDLDFTYSRFNRLLEPIVWDVDVVLQEIRDVRLSFEDVFFSGNFRGSGG